MTDVLEKLCEVDKCVSQIDLRKRRARQALITDIFRMYTQCAIGVISFISHPYTQICKLFPHIGFCPVGICIIG